MLLNFIIQNYQTLKFLYTNAQNKDKTHFLCNHLYILSIYFCKKHHIYIFAVILLHIYI